jgi:adenine phosphoribosyltransferase
MTDKELGMDYASRIRDVPNFPIEGILFKDITPLLSDGEAFRACIDDFAARLAGYQAELIVGMESRGFIFATPLAFALGLGFVPVRRLGKLPAASIRVEYQLEYGENSFEMHRDAIRPGQRVLIVDDVLATGGTVNATISLVEQLGGQVAAVGFLLELIGLEGRKQLEGRDVVSLIKA